MQSQKKGRPPLPESERRNDSVRLFLNPSESDALFKAARAKGLSPPSLLRMLLTEAGVLGEVP